MIKTDAISKSFGDLKAVSELSMQVRSGEVFGFLGPNGAGKTTSISMICGLLKPDEGEVIIHDQNVKVNRDIFHRIGLCPQKIVLWNRLTCVEQLVFLGTQYGVPRKIAKQRGEVLLAELGLSEKTHKLAATLSGGMQRRLNLIMAMVHEPDILILDEPEAGLDPQSRVMVREKIKDWVKLGERSVIMTSHNMDEVERIADRVAIVDQGKLLVLDTPAALKATIGSGDVLEMAFPDLDRKERGDPAEFLDDLVLDVQSSADRLILRSPQLIRKMPVILERLEENGFRIGEVKLRENTLEDVFISLTGRRLRE